MFDTNNNMAQEDILGVSFGDQLDIKDYSCFNFFKYGIMADVTLTFDLDHLKIVNIVTIFLMFFRNFVNLKKYFAPNSV